MARGWRKIFASTGSPPPPPPPSLAAPPGPRQRPRPPAHPPQERRALRGPPLIHARIPEAAQERSSLLHRDEEAEAAQRMLHLGAPVAQADHHHRGIGNG